MCHLWEIKEANDVLPNMLHFITKAYKSNGKPNISIFILFNVLKEKEIQNKISPTIDMLKFLIFELLIAPPFVYIFCSKLLSLVHRNSYALLFCCILMLELVSLC